MRALILGATGFLGGQIARAACQAGMEIHGLRRRPGAVGALGDLPVRWRQGDLADRDSLVPAMQTCDLVYHAAAYYPRGEHRIEVVVRQARDQMRTVLNAAREAGVKRLVYTGSVATVGTPPPGSDRLADERDDYVPGSSPSAYYEAKWVMEQEARQAASNGLPVVILLPTAVFGPEDAKPTTSEVVLRVAQGRVPVAVDVVTNFVDGRDVALAHVRAALLGTPGERIIVGGHNLNVAAMIAAIVRIAGVRPPRWMLSRQTASRVLRLAGALRLPVPNLLLGIDQFQPVNAEKGWQLFGLAPRPFEETIHDTVAWFRENKYL